MALVRDSRPGGGGPPIPSFASRASRAAGGISTGEWIALGAAGAGAVGIAVIAAGQKPGGGIGPSGPQSSISYQSVQPPSCPPCGLYKTPDGSIYAVDANAVSYWIQDETAFTNCGYSHAVVKAIGFEGLGRCGVGPTITNDCSTCPCGGLPIWPCPGGTYCADVPCPCC